MIYDRPTWQLLADAAAELDAPFSEEDVVAWFAARYPKLKATSVIAHIGVLTATDPNRKHHEHLGRRAPVLFQTDAGLVPYDPDEHGAWDHQGQRTEASGGPLDGLSPAVPFTWYEASASPRGPGLHVVFDENDEVAYVGVSEHTRDRLKQHLRGDRIASALHKNLGEELDEQFGTTASAAEIEEHLGSFSIGWLECAKVDAQRHKEAIISAFDPRLCRRGAPATRLWWVNQGRSFDDERRAGLVFAGRGDGEREAPAHHRNVTRLRPGHRIIHYAAGEIRAVGTVTARSQAMTRPYGPVPERDEGNGAAVAYEVLDRPIALGEIDPRLPGDGPFDKNGSVKQQYLMPVSEDFVRRLVSQFPDRLPADLAPKELPPMDDLIDGHVARFKHETGYPTARNAKKQVERQQLAASLTPEGLDQLADDRVAARHFFNRFAGGAYGSPGNQSVFNRGLQDDANVDRAVEVARYLLHTDSPSLEQRIDHVLTDPTMKVPGLHEALVTKLLAISHPDAWIPSYSANRKKGKVRVLAALGLPQPEPTGSIAARMVASNATLHAALEPHFGEDAWGMQEFGWWLMDQAPFSEPGPPDDGAALDVLAAELFVDRAFLDKVIRLLEDRRQVVFYGPPGTGKTYLARKLAEHLTTTGEVVKVQFHPSYSYEDFVEGYRPRVVNGTATFDLVDGPLKEIAAAAADSDAIHVLLIDELNRGNVAKILGELYFLLEYRDEEMRLQYSQAPFSLPENLWIIATMNTADRSIALVDAALRRRFHFVPFFPSEPPVADLLERWLAEHRPEMAWVAALVRQANRKLPNEHLAIGPSHFLRADLDDEWLELVWEHSVIPYLEDQFFGEEDRLPDFELAKLRAELDRSSSSEDDARP